LEKYLFYAKPLDFLSISILKELYRFGPRNISFISRHLGFPKRTIYLKYTKMIEKINLKIKAVPKYSMLGLVHTFVLITPRSISYYHDILEKIRDNPYFIEAWQFHNNVLSLASIAVVPIEAISYLYDFIETFKLAEHVRVYTTQTPYPFLPDFTQYNIANTYWEYTTGDFSHNYDKIYLPDDPRSFKLLVDKIDLEIIKKLHEDASIKMSTIAKQLNISRPRVKYHYDNHVHPILLDRYAVVFSRFNEPTIYTILYTLFKSKRDLAKAIAFLSRGPFLHYICKEIKKQGAIFFLEIPRRSLEDLLYNYLKALDKNTRIKRYFYLILGKKIFERNISTNLFDNKRWNVDIFLRKTTTE